MKIKNKSGHHSATFDNREKISEYLEFHIFKEKEGLSNFLLQQSIRGKVVECIIPLKGMEENQP